MDNLSSLKEHENDYIKFLLIENVTKAAEKFNNYKNLIEIYYRENNYNEDDISKEMNNIISNFIQNINSYAETFMQKGNYDKAVLCYSEILKYLPKDIDFLINYVVCLHKTKHYEIQDKIIKYILDEIIPIYDYIAYNPVAYMFADINDFENAYLYQEKYLQQCPDEIIDEQDYYILGSFLLSTRIIDVKRYETAINYAKKGLLLNNSSRKLISLLGDLYIFINKDAMAIKQYEKLMQLNDISNGEKLNYATTHFKNKNFKKYYENELVYFFKNGDFAEFFETVNKPMWKGENLSDKTLLVLYDQGYGDTILIWGYLKRLSKLAKKIVFVVQSDLYCLLKDNDLNIEVILPDSDYDCDFDYYIPAMSVMSALNLDESSLPVGEGYIKADKDLVQLYKEKYFNNDKLKIGLTFLGYKSDDIKFEKYRDIPVKEFLPLDELDNVELYSLSKGAEDELFKDFKKNKVHNLSDKLVTFKDTAAFMENCDLIISSDNVLLNLAGALGKKTFGLFNWYYEWRWYDLTGEDVGFYTSVKPFVNPSLDDWKSSMTRVIEEIKAIQNNKTCENELGLIKEKEQVYISLLQAENISLAIKAFNNYKKLLEKYYIDNGYDEDTISNEMLNLIKNFIKHISSVADGCMEKEDYDDAVLCYSEILKYLPKDIKSLSDYVICLYKTEHYEIQNKVLNYLLELLPKDDCFSYKRLVYIYNAIGDLKQAIINQKKYIEQSFENEINENDYAFIGKLYRDLYIETGDINCCNEGIKYLNKGLLKNNKSLLILDLLVKLYCFMNENNASLNCLKTIFELNDKIKENESKYTYALINFKNKNFEEFYKYYKYRFYSEDKNNREYFPKIDKPLWNGEDIHDKTLLVQSEQGFGDTILMWGYAKRLAELAKHVIFMVQPELCSLLENNEWNIEVVPKTIKLELLNFDCYVPMMDIPKLLNLNISNISVGEGYIKADKDLIHLYKEKYFNNNKLKIGLTFLGRKTKSILPVYRDIPVKEFLPLDELDNVELYSLTKDVDDKYFKDFKKNKVHNLSDKLVTFRDTAAVMENCDLIISSDNVLLNLAGALGKKTFGLFNWYYEWRWYDLTGEDVGWFTSVKPFVNPSLHDWKSSMTKVVEEIKKIQKERFS